MNCFFFFYSIYLMWLYKQAKYIYTKAFFGGVIQWSQCWKSDTLRLKYFEYIYYFNFRFLSEGLKLHDCEGDILRKVCNFPWHQASFAQNIPSSDAFLFPSGFWCLLTLLIVQNKFWGVSPWFIASISHFSFNIHSCPLGKNPCIQLCVFFFIRKKTT